MDYNGRQNGARTNGDQSGSSAEFRVSFVSDREMGFQEARRGSSRTQGAHLYFIKMEGSRPVKIGRANQPEIRLATLQVASPYRLKLLGVIDNCGEHELDFHWHLRADRMLGEWFKWSPTVEQTVQLALDGADWRSLIKRPDIPPPDDWWAGSPLYEAMRPNSVGQSL